MTPAEILLKLDLYAAALVKLTTDLNALRELVQQPEEPPPPLLEVSPDGTTIPPADHIADAGKAIWTLRDGIVWVGDKPAGYTNGADAILKHATGIYHRNLAQNWYRWSGNTWFAIYGIPGSVPPPLIVVPPPTPPPTPPPGPKPAGALSVRGKDLVDADGNVVILRGVSLMGLDAAVRDREGNYRKMIEVASTWKSLNCIRLPVYPDNFASNPTRYIEEYLKPAVALCLQKNITPIVDYHEFEDPLTNGSIGPRLGAAWDRISAVYKNDPRVLFEIYNEPISQGGSIKGTWTRWRDYIQTYVDRIRRIAPDNIILVGGPSYSQWMGDAADVPVSGSNIGYVFHLYPAGYYHLGDGQHTPPYGPKWWDFHCGRAAKKVPFVITEYGFGADNYRETQGDLKSFGLPSKAWVKANGISWTAWPFDHAWQPPMFAEPGYQKTNAAGQHAKDWIAEYDH